MTSQVRDRPMREIEALVVGAGFSGMYMLHRLRVSGIAAQVIERAGDVGGTWWWNRYPGARCDVDSLDYSYSFDEELAREWEWTERFATQEEILRYAAHVADRLQLRRDIRFGTCVESADWDEEDRRWTVRCDDGDVIAARWLLLATGSLSTPKEPEYPGLGAFAGDWHQTARWPHDGVRLAGRRVAVIGTGSTGIQLIPAIAPEVAHLTVLQRTPQFSVPARNRPIPDDYQRRVKADYPRHRLGARKERGGNMRTLDFPEAGFGVRPTPNPERAVDSDPRAIRAELERRWRFGGAGVMLGSFADLLVDSGANAIIADFVREKIRETVDDPAVAATLTPDDHPFGAKRLPANSDYFETFNRDDVTLVDLRETPITEIVADGIRCGEELHPCDVIVFATGYDALTGALRAIDPRGRDGMTLCETWRDGPRSYLGLAVAGFPNLFTITGPGSPSVLSNMMHSIEQHVQWLGDLLDHAARHGVDRIEATSEAQDAWQTRITANADATLLPRANSWYMGANVPGKPRAILPFVGGVWPYRRILERVQDDGYAGLALGPSAALAD